jgi:DNA-binding MarR family transcriptional regulator
MHQYPTLFGRGVRERVLAAIAVSGPVHLSAISKHIDVANNTVWHAAQHLEKCGVIQASRRSSRRTYVTLNTASPISKEIDRLGKRLVFICGIRKIPGAHHRHGLRRKARINLKKLEDLFVTRSGTRVLLLIAAAGEVEVADLSRGLGIDEAVAKVIVERLERHGIVCRRTDWKRKPITLNPQHAVAKELSDLLAAILRVRPNYAATAALIRRNTGVPRARPVSRRGLSKLDKAVLLVPILHPTYAKVLIVIASRGQVRMADLVAEVNLYGNAVRGVVKRLIAAGLVREHPHRGRFIAERSFSLDQRHACSRELHKLLCAACSSVGLTYSNLRRRTEPARSKATWPPDHRGRAAFALALFQNGASDVGMLAKACHAKRRQIADRARIMEEAGYVQTYPIGRSLWIRVDDDAVASKELTTLLRALLRNGLRSNRLRIMGSAEDGS